MADFDPEKFINREKEIALVVDRVSDLIDGKPFKPMERIFHFVGPSGIGKSSLLKRICYLLDQKYNKQGVIPILVDLVELKGGGNELVGELLKTIYLRFCEYKDIKINPVLEEPLKSRGEYASMIVRAIALHKSIVPVLLLDEINVPPPKEMDEIEKYLLARFINENQLAVLVTAGRLQTSMFLDFALRPNLTNTHHLSVFDEERTGMQMEILKPRSGELAGKVQELGNGVPGNTVKLVEYVSGDPLDISDEAQAIQSLLEDIKKDNKIEERYILLLEALSILQGFIPEDVAALFQCHPQLGGIVWDERKVKEEFLKLKDIQIGHGGLIDWEREKKHWAMDERTRDLFERELQMRNPKLWRKLHCTAMKMYQHWWKQYNSNAYRIKSEYHQHCLQDAGMTCE